MSEQTTASRHTDVTADDSSLAHLIRDIDELNAETSRGLANRAGNDGPLTLGRALWRTVAGFSRAYWYQRGQRDDWRGLCAAVTAEMHRWLTLMKRWERSLPQSAPSEPFGSQHGEARHAAGAPRDRLTILLMTKNEERRIERCLESVSWADQIVVVDGESTDRTVELCRRFVAEVVVRPFSGSFAEERNAGLDVATGDWILQLDADEVVTPELREALERLLASRERRYQAYQVRRRNIFLGRFMRYGGWYHNHLCVFLREGHRYHGLVHERLNIDGPTGHLNADVQHEPFHSIEQFVTRHNRYTTLQARELFETKDRLPWWTVSRALRWRPLTRFWKFYVKKQGFREGMHGLVFSALYAWVEFLYWAKYCELAYPVTAKPQKDRKGAQETPTTRDWLVVGLMAVGAVLLLANLHNGYLWQDEAETALLSRNILRFGYPKAFDGRNLLEIPGAYGNGPGEAWIYNPWLPFYLLAAVFALAGESTWMARLPFALCGLLTLVVTWRLACRLTSDRRIQRLSVALLACSVPFLLHMRQCRYYAMATLLFMGACWTYLRFLTRPSLTRAIGSALVLALLFHTNFGTFVPTAAALFLHQARWGTRETSRRFLIAMGIVILLTFPWALLFYRPAFIGELSLERAYRHLEYYIRITNKFLVPIGFMVATTAVFALMRLRSVVQPQAHQPLTGSLRGFLWLAVALQAAFLLLPDQRHMRYLMPVVPLLVIGEAWWLVRGWMDRPWRLAGWIVVGLTLFTNVLQSPRPEVPLVNFGYELTHRYVGPMEGVVDYLRSHSRPDDVVKTPYDDRTIIFYTNLKVEQPSEFLYQTDPDWIVIRRGWIPSYFFEGSYFRRIDATYKRIELDAPDAFWQNREDPGLHHFQRAWWPPPIVIYRKRSGTRGLMGGS